MALVFQFAIFIVHELFFADLSDCDSKAKTDIRWSFFFSLFFTEKPLVCGYYARIKSSCKINFLQVRKLQISKKPKKSLQLIASIDVEHSNF